MPRQSTGSTNAPALDDPSDRSRRPCAKPGPQFKPQPMVEMAGPPVTGNGGLWMSPSSVVFQSAAGTVLMPRPLRFAESTTSVPALDLTFSSPSRAP